MARIERGPDQVARGGHRIIELGLQKRELFAFLRLQFGLGRRGLGQHLGEKFKARLEIGAEQLERKDRAVVARVRVKRGSELFDVLRELLRVAAARALDEQVGREPR